MNDQQELDAKDVELSHLRNQVEGLRLRVKIIQDDRDRWLNNCRIKWHAIAATYVSPGIGIGIAIGWYFL